MTGSNVDAGASPVSDAGGHALAPGDVLFSKPCTVTIRSRAGDVADGWCAWCLAEHVIDAARFDRGGRPWRRMEPAASGPKEDA